jgi:hypothetical protein
MAITNGYVTLNELKSYLKIDDSTEDALLEQIVESASRSIDRIANRRFYLDANASARQYRATGAVVALIDDIGTTSGLIVQIDQAGDGTFATTLTLNSDYLVEPFNALAQNRPITRITMISGFFPEPFNYRPGIQVTARWGFPTVPDDIVEATLILSADLYKRKDSIGGVLGLSELGAIRMSPLGRDIAAITKPYQKITIA